MKVAITGCIGSGKSYYLNKIHEIYGYDIYSSDAFVMESYEDEAIKEKLNEAFNCVIDNKVNKKIIKEKLNDENIKLLNSIIHPYVINKIKSLDDDKLIFVEVPLLFETNMDKYFDLTISISLDDKLRYQRLKNRDVKNFENMLKLEKFQLNNKEKSDRANFTLSVNENDEHNLSNLDKIIKDIKREV